jgi:Putative MetA-pathway of phenol degradation
MNSRLLGAFMTAFCCGQSLAQSVTLESNTDLSKEAENPVTRRVTVPLRYEANFNDGPYGATKDTYELDQAVLPFRLDEDWALITRTKFPTYSQPPKKVGDHWESGLGNGYTTFFLSPEHGEGFYWGVGPVLSYPSATNAALGVNKWGSGPSVAIVRKDQSPWVLGAVVNNIWSFGGPPHGSDRTNGLLLNLFVSYHFGDGWSVGSSPNITANWLSATGQQWTAPIGGAIDKTFRLARQPMKLSVGTYYNAVRPQAAHEAWLLQVTLTFVFAN